MEIHWYNGTNWYYYNILTITRADLKEDLAYSKLGLIIK